MNKTEKEFLSVTYKKLSHKDHIKKLTDTYIGSVQNRNEHMFILRNDEEPKIEYKEINYNPGLFKIFDEIIVNSYDQFIRLSNDKTSKDLIITNKIKVWIDVKKTRTLITIFNNGNGIPVVKHPEHDQWIPELLFGELLTSTNYDFEADKVTAGKNGYGAKLTNIFSKKFTVETVDHLRGKKYIQTFSRNMEEKSTPEVTDTTEEPYTQFTFEPDLKMFNLKEISADMVALMARRTYDIGAFAGRSVALYYNGKRIPVKDFQSYVHLYTNSFGGASIYQKINERWEIAVAFTPNNTFQQISFVNGVYTRLGGTHVTYIMNQLIKEITLYLHKRYKTEIGGRQIKPQYIRDNIWLFLKVTITNPAFDSQTKESLTNTPENFGSTADIDENLVKKIVGTGLGDKIVEIINQKEGLLLAKQDKSASKQGLKIPKLDDATLAGTSKWTECTLILTEGDSAKALAISGLSIIGREQYGVFPLKGKILNVREHKLLKINENEEIANIKKILGLEYGKKYTDLSASPLRYRYVMIMADQDYDGSHIKGLFFNFIHTLWPELIINHNFIRSLLTPIVKVIKGDEVVSFYNAKEYQKWVDKGLKGWTIKYYKGLGTNTAKEAREYFKAINTNTISYIWDEKSNDSLALAFDGARADERKEWLAHINDKEHEPINQATQMKVTYQEFVDKELIYFSNYDNTRSIPSALDGLKPAQRKILFAGFKKKLAIGTEIKVAQFVGYVSEHTSYHHGEASLAGAIIAMAQNFVGSNNINLLEPSGQFGTRLAGGKDAASPRYIFTEFSYYKDGTKKYITPLLFPPEDHELLDILEDDGMKIEPRYYVPIIPMLLVNGATGIGTGFSTDIPAYNPKDIINNLRLLMAGKDTNVMYPWYRGFKGKILSAGENMFSSNGVYRINGSDIEIDELPLGVWTDGYKDYLETMKAEKKEDGLIKKIINQSTDQSVKIILKCDKKSLDERIDNLIKILKMQNMISQRNMHAFDVHGNIKKYNSPEDILKDFYPIRLALYKDRKKYMLKSIKDELTLLENKKDYIEYIIDHKDVLFKSKDEIIEKIKDIGIKADDYGFLLRMSALSFSKEMVKSLKDDYSNKKLAYEELAKKTEIDLWNRDLDVFMDNYEHFIKN